MQPPVPIVLGSVTWSFYADPPADKRAAITAAMDFAVNAINTVARYSGNIPVAYQASVPTAQANFQRSIEFGGAISGGTALHEAAHWFGVGYVRWGSLMVDGQWQGTAGKSRIRAYDGPDAVLRGDRAHFWPYGWNNNREYISPQRHLGMVGAMRRDMGLSDGTSETGGVYAIQNRSNQLLLDYAQSGNAFRPVQRAPVQPSGQRWEWIPGDGFITIRSLVTGLLLDSLATTADGAEAGVAAASGGTTQQWEMVPTDNGWFLLSNRATGRCLDNVGASEDGASIRMWSCGGHPNQQWRLARWP